LTLLVVAFVLVMVALPLGNVFARAFHGGARLMARTLTAPHTLAALRLTFLAAVLAVGANLTFGLAVAWAVARFRFPGKALLTALIDLPFTVSPVVAGLLFVLLFGAHGYLGPWLARHHLRIIFAVPGVVLATTFVTVPFIARELIPVLEAVGPEEEQAARTLGASGGQVFWHITLPNIKWGLLYGLALCQARALGEFGAVSVVSGKLAGQTDTLPITIEKLYQGVSAESTDAAFVVAALLAGLAMLTLLGKAALEWKTRRGLGPARERDTEEWR
jgi:sulfate transport system permease protein